MDGLQKVIIPMTLDLLRRSNQQIAVVNVGEAASRQLEIALTRGRIPFIPGEELSVTVYALKPDGTKVFSPCELRGNIVRMNITTQMTAASGVIKCNLRIGTAESVLFSSMFYLESYDTVFSDAAVESTDEFTALSQALRYQHIRYAPKKPTANSDMTEDPDDLTAYIGVAVTLSPEAPHDYTKYKWCSYRGKPGAIFTPHVSEDGILSWTNDQNLDNPTPVNIKGPTGDIGPTGPTGAQGETGPAGIVISETEPTDESHPVWIRPSGEYIVENLGISGATVGQVPAVKAVDENGVPTEWEAADGDGGSKPFIVTVTYGDNGTLTADKTHAEIVAAYAAGAQINAKIVNYPGVNAPCILPLYVNNSDERFIFSGSGVLDGRAMAMTAQDFNGSWSVSLTGIAKQDDIPTSLKNPQSLVLESEGNNKVYDGSSAVNVVIPCNTKVMTVTAAGAKGDGVTDDTAAFKTALENYRNVFVPGGTYKLTEGITIRDACKLELAPDAVLNFTQTTGNCISMKMSAYLCGNHAVIEVPYGFSGNVIYVSTSLNTSVNDVPPFTKWDPQWKTARYITDISISKQDSRGFHYSIDGGCSGTAVYIEADGGATSTFIWGLNFSGIRIAGAFSYGIHAKTIGSGYNHEMRLEALIDACEIGLCLEDCNNAYAAVTVQPRPALTTGEESIAYAKHGIQLIRSRNTDLSGARVWDWNADKTLWTSDAGCEYQHIAMVGNCSGTILNDFLYYEMPSYDIRSLIYTDTPANLEKITILQEPFTRWFRPVDNKPMFYDGSANNELLLKSAFDAAFQTDMVANFDNKLLKSANADGTIFNDTGYQSGAGWSTDGVTLNTGSEYAEITCTGFIPCSENAVIRLKGMSFASGNDYCRVVLFDSSKAKLMHVNRANLISNASSYYINNYTETEDGCQFTIVSASAAYFKLNVFTSTLGASPAISVNEEMSYRQEGYLADGIKVKATAVEGGGGTDTSLGLTGATVGQVPVVKTVDGDGKPTEWEAGDASGGSGTNGEKLLVEYVHSSNEMYQPTSFDPETGIFTCPSHGLVGNTGCFAVMNNDAAFDTTKVPKGNYGATLVPVDNDSFKINGWDYASDENVGNIDCSSFHYEHCVTFTIKDIPLYKKIRVVMLGKVFCGSWLGFDCSLLSGTLLFDTADTGSYFIWGRPGYAYGRADGIFFLDSDILVGDNETVTTRKIWRSDSNNNNKQFQNYLARKKNANTGDSFDITSSYSGISEQGFANGFVVKVYGYGGNNENSSVQ